MRAPTAVPQKGIWLLRSGKRAVLVQAGVNSNVRKLTLSHWPELSEAEQLLKDATFGLRVFPLRGSMHHIESLSDCLFHPTPQVDEKSRELLEAVQERGKTLVCVHIRRGDFWQYPDYGIIFAAPIEWCLAQLREIWAQVDSPVFVVCSDEPDKVFDPFQEFNPFTSQGLSPGDYRLFFLLRVWALLLTSIS